MTYSRIAPSKRGPSFRQPNANHECDQYPLLSECSVELRDRALWGPTPKSLGADELQPLGGTKLEGYDAPVSGRAHRADEEPSPQHRPQCRAYRPLQGQFLIEVSLHPLPDAVEARVDILRR